MNQMTPQQALNVLDIATQPGVKLVREDFVNIQRALETVRVFVEANTPKKEDTKE